MTIEPAYSFVLWAIPRFHRADAAQGEIPAANVEQAGIAPKSAHDPLAKGKQPLFEKSGAKTFAMLGHGLRRQQRP